jgi:hypothetical protein
MKQNAGIIATLTLFLAFFGLSGLPKNAPGAGASSEAKSKVVSKSATTSSNSSAPHYVACEEIRNRLRPFLSQTPPEGWQLPNSCYPDNSTPKSSKPMVVPAELHFVIATAPNPVSTHLPLMFDRMIEAIQQAAQDDQFSYDSSWFPWNEADTQAARDDQSPSGQNANEETKDLQHDQPGVVVFRRALKDDADGSPYLGGLVVFVVAEEPTGGIDQKEFDNALAWIDRLGALTQQRGLVILGPTFSGSLPSLDLALDNDKLKRPASELPVPIIVSSGSVSSELSFRWFNTRMVNNHHGSFRTATQGDDIMVDRLCQYLFQVEQYPFGHLAVISEDETAFGATVDGDKGETNASSGTASNCIDQVDKNNPKVPIHLYYPRDISTLRSAYERQSIFSTGRQASSPSAVTTTLRGDLSEPHSSDHDTVRSYGGQLTPLAQEAVLLRITSILKAKQIQFVILRSTNSLDQIFLTQFFRRAYPDARIVIDGSDLLFQRAAEGAPLRGVMVLSTYPLLAWQQDSTLSLVAPKNGSYRIFGEDITEGLYIAAREQFRDSSRDTSVPINNYGAPSWAVDSSGKGTALRPGTWISVIAHGQFWPVATLDTDTLGKNTAGDILLTGPERGDELVPRQAAHKHPLRITLELVVLLIMCSAWSVLHLVWCCRGSITPLPAIFRLAQFAPIGRKQHPFLIAFGSLLPAAVAVVIATSCGLVSWSLDGWRGAILMAWTLLILLASFLACERNFKLRIVSCEPSGNNSSSAWQKKASLAAAVFFLIFVLSHIRLVHGLTTANGIPAYWRNAHLLSGVSALLPQVILMAGCYLWFWFSLRGLAMFGDDRPLLPPLESLPAIDNPADRTPVMPMFSRETAAKPVEDAAIPVGRYYLVWFIPCTLFATLVIFALMLKGHSLRTIGEREFGVLMFYWLSLCVAIILADTLQVWVTWRELRPLLVYLDRLPLRRTLASLKGLSWGSVWGMSGNTLEERYRVISRQLESLRHLGNFLIEQTPNLSLPPDCKSTVLSNISQCQKQGRTFATWYVKLAGSPSDISALCQFQEELATTAGSVMKNVLLPAWQQEKDSLIFDRTHSGTKDVADGSVGPILPASVPPYVLAAEEFFVLPYLAFIQNILGRVRTIVLGSLFLFVAATFAVSSYPFDPLPVLGGVFLAVFVITGGTVVLVFAKMHRDATLSHITNTQPGELGGQFWLHLVTFGIGPLLGLLTTLFPAMTDFVTSWLQPSMQALQ